MVRRFVVGNLGGTWVLGGTRVCCWKLRWYVGLLLGT